MALTKLREDYNLFGESGEWSAWEKAMVPKLPSKRKQRFEERQGNRPGYICVNIKSVFKNYRCGIYEWKAVSTRTSKEVYIGSTCREKRGALQDRVMEYCRNGSHKSELIDDALEKGYELHVRVQETGGSKVRAEDLENEFLSEYNYAWNVRNNAVRNVLP